MGLAISSFIERLSSFRGYYGLSFLGKSILFQRDSYHSSGGAPYDGAARERLRPNHLALVSTFSIAAIAGIVYAVVCLVFNIVFRNRK